MFRTRTLCKAPLSLRPFNPFRGQFLGPSGPKLETELKMSSRGLPAPGSKKLKTESKKESKKLKKSWNFHFSTLFRLCFELFGPRGRKAPGTHFQLCFQLWARRAQELWGDWRVATSSLVLDREWPGCPAIRVGMSWNHDVSPLSTCSRAISKPRQTPGHTKLRLKRFLSPMTPAKT